MSGSNQSPEGGGQSHTVNITGNVGTLTYGSVNQSSSSRYSQVMAAHGIGYWALHFVIAAVAAFIVELILRFF